jgi:hypothetical protein
MNIKLGFNCLSQTRLVQKDVGKTLTSEANYKLGLMVETNVVNIKSETSNSKH